MKQGGTLSSQYSPLIAKNLVEGSKTSLTKPAIKPYSEPKTEKPIDWASESKIESKKKLDFINETKKDQI